MSKETSGARFGVGTPEGPRAAVWRLWTSPSGDVYFGARGLTRELKISLHQSGKWRFGFTEQHMAGSRPLIADGDRSFGKWDRPPAPGGLTKAFEIFTADPDVISPRAEIDVEVAWVPCPIDSEIVFTIVLGPGGVERGPWPGRHDPQRARLIYREALGNGETLWVVSHAQPLSHDRRRELVLQRARAAAKAAEDGIRLDLQDPELRCGLMGEYQGTGRIQDLALAALVHEPGALGLSTGSASNAAPV